MNKRIYSALTLVSCFLMGSTALAEKGLCVFTFAEREFHNENKLAIIFRHAPSTAASLKEICFPYLKGIILAKTGIYIKGVNNSLLSTKQNLDAGSDLNLTNSQATQLYNALAEEKGDIAFNVSFSKHKCKVTRGENRLPIGREQGAVELRVREHMVVRCEVQIPNNSNEPNSPHGPAHLRGPASPQSSPSFESISSPQSE